MRRNAAEITLSAWSREGSLPRSVGMRFTPGQERREGASSGWRRRREGEREREGTLVSRDNRRRGANQPRIRKAASRCWRVGDDASLVHPDTGLRYISLVSRTFPFLDRSVSVPPRVTEGSQSWGKIYTRFRFNLNSRDAPICIRILMKTYSRFPRVLVDNNTLTHY